MADDLENVDAESIAKELMGEMDLSGGEVDKAPAATDESPDPNPAALPENAQDGPPPGTAAFDAMPKAWRREMEAHWARLDPEVRKYVHSREADVSRGIQMYQQGHTSWNKLLEPYKRIFEAYPQVDPVALLQGVMNQHLKMAQGRPEEKVEILRSIAKSYGVDLATAAQIAQQANPADQQIQTLTQRLEQMERMWSAAQNALAQENYKKTLTSVEEFSSSPKNKYWSEVVEDVLHLLKKGASSTLEEAYELACYRNPSVRAKMFEEQAKPASTGNVAKFPNLSSDTTAPPRTKKRSMDETVDEIVAKYAKEL